MIVIIWKPILLLNTNLDDKKLWNIALHGHPVVAALALAYLDSKYDGKIMEALKQQLKDKSDKQK